MWVTIPPDGGAERALCPLGLRRGLRRRSIERLREAGVEIVEEPADQPWGERVARVHDPDGNLVIIGQR